MSGVDPVTGKSTDDLDISTGIVIQPSFREGLHAAYDAVHVAIEVSDLEEAAKAKAKEALAALKLAHVLLPFLSAIPVIGPAVAPVEMAIESLLGKATE